MRHYFDLYMYAGALDPVVSLDSLVDDGLDETGASTFDYLDPSPGPDEQFELVEASVAISTFVASLKPRDQEIIRRVFWRGESQTFVAKQLGVSKMAISKAVARICTKAQQALTPYRYSRSELDDAA